jgi:hypothetical protein
MLEGYQQSAKDAFNALWTVIAKTVFGGSQAVAFRNISTCSSSAVLMGTTPRSRLHRVPGSPAGSILKVLIMVPTL